MSEVTRAVVVRGRDAGRALVFIVGLISFNHGYCAEKSPVWKGSAELGVISTNGNTKTQNITARGKAIYQRHRWRHSVDVEVLKSSEKGTTTAERYFVSGKSEFKIDGKSYVFGLVSYDNNRFSGFDYRWREIVGYGRDIIERSDLVLHLEAGVGARQSKVSDTGVKENEGLFHAGGHLRWNIGTGSVLTEDLYTDIGSRAAISKSVTALSTQIAGNLASKIAFSATHTSHVPYGFKKLDTETTITLVYNF